MIGLLTPHMHYQEVKEIIDGIVKAIKNGDYRVSYEDANNIRECTAPDGRTFYKVVDMDDAKSSTDFGSCTVEVAGYEFSCSWEYGDYESTLFDEIDDEYELEDGTVIHKEDLVDQIIDALIDRDDIFFGTYTDVDSQMELFAKIYHIKNPEYYWYEDDYCPIDISSGWHNYTAPVDLGYGTVYFNRFKYYLVEEPTNEEAEQLHAVHCKTKPDDKGRFETVILDVCHLKDGKIKVTACEASDECYSAVDGWIE